MSTKISELTRPLFQGQADAVALAGLEETRDIPVLSSADASTALAAGVVYAADVSADIVAAWWVSPTSGSNNAADYATINVRKYTAASAGTVSAVVATFCTSTTANSISANMAKAFTLVDSLTRLAPGDALRVDVAKTSAGLSTAAGTVRIRTRRV